LVDEDLAGFCTQVLDLVFLKLYRLARTIPSYCKKDVRLAMIGCTKMVSKKKEEEAETGGVRWRRGEMRRYGT